MSRSKHSPAFQRAFHDGREDGLDPLQPLDLSRIASFGDLLVAMEQTAFGGRQLGMALRVLQSAARHPGCRIVMTISGAMTVAKQGKIVCDLIEAGLVHAIVATGALIAHGLTESMGLVHYRWSPHMDDEELFAKGYNRIYDTLEMESNLNEIEELVRGVLDEGPPEGRMWSSASFCRALGRALARRDARPAILRAAVEHRVPVFIPAFTDSELGLDMAVWQLLRILPPRSASPPTDQRDLAALNARVLESIRNPEVPIPSFNPFLDVMEYARWVEDAEALAIWTIGGGVPRNWAQQIGPFFDVINERTGSRIPVPRFWYGVRICPEPVHWGGLSGCTYSEGVSWGKFVPESEGGRFAEVHADATTVLPLLAKALLDWRAGEVESE